MEINNARSLSDYTEKEFVELLSNFFENKKGLKGRDLGKYIDELQKHVVNVTQHPLGNGLIFNTPDNIDCTPEGIVKEIKRWRKSQGLPLFKDPQ